MAVRFALRTGIIAVDMPLIQSTSNTAMVSRRAWIWARSPDRISMLRVLSARRITSRGATDDRIDCISTAEIQRSGIAWARAPGSPARSGTLRTGRMPAGPPAGRISTVPARRRRAMFRLDRAASNRASSVSRRTVPAVCKVTVPLTRSSMV